MSSTLLGSQPQVYNESAITPGQAATQQYTLGNLTDILGESMGTGGEITSTSTGTLPAIGQSALQNQSLAAMEQLLTQPGATASTTGQTTNTTNAQNTLNSILTGSSATTPTTVTPQNVSAQQITAPQINATQAFQQGVVQPLTQNFQQQVIPTIEGQQGASAGAAGSSGEQQSYQEAAQNLQNTLAGYGSEFAYNAAAANQSTALSAAQSNQSANLSGQQSNQSTNLAGQQSNQSTNLASQEANLSALISGLSNTSSITGLPSTLANQQLANASAGVTAGQTNFSNIQTILSDLLGLGTANDINTVATGGSTGLLQGLFTGGGLALSGGGTSSILSALGLSDERVKDDVEQIGEVEGFPIYRFKYKGSQQKHIGVMAQDVEKRVPEAVVTGPHGYKMVDYGRVMQAMLEAA